MSKRVFWALVFIGLSSGAQAYPYGGESAEHRQMRLAHLAEKLNLSEVQQQEIAALWDRQREQYAEIRAEAEAGMQEILGAEQYAKLNSCKKREGHAHGHHAKSEPSMQ